MRVDSPSTGSTLDLQQGTRTSNTTQKDQFLRLLVAQLENQNPLDPQDGAEFVAQLAQFSSLEQAVETNQRLGSLSDQQASSSNAALASLVGHDGTATASTLQLDGPPPPMQIQLGGPISGGDVIIRDTSGAEVRRITLGAGQDTIDLPWDGLDSQGVPVKPGAYTIEVKAHSADGSAVSATPKLHGVIESVELTDDGPRLRIGHALIAPADVTSFGLPGGTV